MRIEDVLIQIRSYMALHHLSEAEFARRAEIPQPTVHRALKAPKRLTSTHLKLCKYANIDTTRISRVDPRSSQELMSALEAVRRNIKADSATAMCLGSTLSAEEASVREGLASFVADVIRNCALVPCDPIQREWFDGASVKILAFGQVWVDSHLVSGRDFLGVTAPMEVRRIAVLQVRNHS